MYTCEHKYTYATAHVSRSVSGTGFHHRFWDSNSGCQACETSAFTPESFHQHTSIFLLITLSK